MARPTRGDSLGPRQPVLSELGRRLPVTVTLGVMAIALAVLVGIPVGVLSAVRQDGVLDFFARSAAILGLSIPGFIQAIIVILLPAIWAGWTPLAPFVAFSKQPTGYVLQFILPAIILGIASAAGIMRLTRAMLLDVLRRGYIR